MEFSHEYRDYWKKTSQSLSDYINSIRDKETEQIIVNTLSFIAFSTENLSSNVTKNVNELYKLYTYIIISIDTLRGALRCQNELSLVSLSLLNRMTFEIHCKIKYMINHNNPIQMIDRNFRFSEVEKFKHASHKNALIKLSSEEQAQIKKNCPEWFDVNGNLRRDNFYWTGEKSVNTFRALTIALGMEEQYISLYSTNSKIVHGSSLALNMYKDTLGNIHFNGRKEQCSILTLMTCNYWIETLELYSQFFGLKLNEDDLALIKIGLLNLFKKYQ